MKAWLALLLSALVFMVALVSAVMGILHGKHGAKAKSRGAPHPTAAPQAPVAPVDQSRSAVPALGLYVAETARDTVFLPDETGRSLPAPHAAADRFGRQLRMSADGTTLLEVYRRGGDVAFAKKGNDEVTYRANNSLVFYRRKDDAWQPYTANMASEKFTSYFPAAALGVPDASGGSFGGARAHCFDVSGEGSYAAVQWLPSTGGGAVCVFAYNGDENYALDEDRASNYVLRVGAASLEGDNFGKVVRFLGDKRLLVAADADSSSAVGGAVRLYRVGTDPQGPVFVPTNPTDPDLVAPAGDRDRSFGDVCQGDAAGTTVWVSNCNDKFSKVYAYQRRSEDDAFGAPALTFDLGSGLVTDIALSDPADYCAVAQRGRVFVFARQQGGGAYASEPVQTLFAPALVDYEHDLGFGAAVRMSRDARVLAVGCDPARPDDLYRSYVFVYRLDPETGRYAVASTATGDPQFLAGTAGSALDFNLTAAGDAATLVRGAPAEGELRTYRLA